jgi:uncharacterized membrane protein YdjX (TVP38/TMEM64 family)
MRPDPSIETLRRVRLIGWLLFAAAFLLLYYLYRGRWNSELRGLAESSLLLGYAVYLALGAVRGFTLIPVTNLVLLGIPLFPPLPLFLLTLAGIAVSSACVYWFADTLRLGEHFERKHPAKTERFRAALGRNPTAIVVAWSFFPLAPTDLICYVCGVMRMPLTRVLIGVLIGEGAICAAYIFAGNSVLGLMQHWLGS